MTKAPSIRTGSSITLSSALTICVPKSISVGAETNTIRPLIDTSPLDRLQQSQLHSLVLVS